MMSVLIFTLLAIAAVTDATDDSAAAANVDTEDDEKEDKNNLENEYIYPDVVDDDGENDAVVKIVKDNQKVKVETSGNEDIPKTFHGMVHRRRLYVSLVCLFVLLILSLFLLLWVPTGSLSRGGDVAVYIFDVNQPSLPTSV